MSEERRQHTRFAVVNLESQAVFTLGLDNDPIKIELNFECVHINKLQLLIIITFRGRCLK